MTGDPGAKAASFLKTTVFGGFFVLLPVVLLYLLVSKTLGLVVELAAPIASLLPGVVSERPKSQVLAAFGLLVATSFLLGLAIRSRRGRDVGSWIQRKMLLPIPGYRALQGLAKSLADSKEPAGFRPAFLVSENGQRELAYLIEDRGHGDVTVMLPWAPTPLAGSVKVVPREQVEMLGASLAEVSQVLSSWGVGAHALLARPGSAATGRYEQ